MLALVDERSLIPESRLSTQPLIGIDLRSDAYIRERMKKPKNV
jgi:hypothetical protein